MKKQLLLTIIFSLLFIFEMDGQVMFQKTIGGTGNDWAYSVQQTTDDGFVITGCTSSFGINFGDAYLIRTNSGNVIWTKTFGIGATDIGYYVQQTNDSGFIVIGSTENTFMGFWDIFLIKTDANGDTLWTKVYGETNGDDYGYAGLQSYDGGYIILGKTSNSATGEIILIKSDNNGNIIWSKIVDGFGEGADIKQTTDSGFIIVGNTSFLGSGSQDIYLIKTNANGDTLWSKAYGGINQDIGYSVQQTSDGGYIITGQTFSFGTGSGNVFLLKTDFDGIPIWTKTYGGFSNHEFGISVQQTNDGGYAIVGKTLTTPGGDVYLIKTNDIGDTLWTRIFGGTSNDEGLSIQQTPDGGYIVAGHTWNFGMGWWEVYLIKTDSSGNSGCNESSSATIVTSPTMQLTYLSRAVTSFSIPVTTPATIVGNGGTVTTLCTTGINEIKNEEEFVLYPNPFDEQIFTSEKGNEPVEITFYDFTGRKIFNQSFINSTTINTRQFAKGIYVYELRNKEGVIKKGKVVKE